MDYPVYVYRIEMFGLKGRMRRWNIIDIINVMNDTFPMLLYLLIPMAIGFAFGLIMAWAEKSENKGLRAEVTSEVAKFCTVENADLRSNADKIAEIFTVRRFKLVQKSPDMLVFSFPSYMHMIMNQFVLISLFYTFGGALGFAIAFVFSGTWPEKIKVDLAPAPRGEGVTVVE